MTRFPAEFIFPGEWFLCVQFERVRLTECILYATGYLNISVVCMPLEVNRCIPLDLFMVLFIGLVFRNDVTSMQSACQKQ